MFHKPTGETWVLACDEDGGRVVCAGWPESMAPVEDCEIRKSATDSERLDMLQRVAKSCAHQSRGLKAQRQLGLG